MFPSSAVQVIERTRDRLVISDPPYYTLGWSLLLLVLVTLAFRFFIYGKGVSLWPGLLIVAPFLIAAVGVLTSRTTFAFSRDTGTVAVDRRTFGIRRSSERVPLPDIRSATVQTGRNSRRLVLVLQSGGIIPMGTLTSQAGDYTAATAINDFLGRGRSQ